MITPHDSYFCHAWQRCVLKIGWETHFLTTTGLMDTIGAVDFLSRERDILGVWG